MLNEKKLTQAELAKREEIIQQMKKNKSSLIKKYGKDAEKVMYGRATNMAKKQAEQMQNEKLQKKRGEIYDALIASGMSSEKAGPIATSKAMDMGEGKKSFPDLTGDGKVTKADILKGRGIELDEDLDIGHQDNEPHMLKSDLYDIGTYAMELYKMMDKFEGEQEVDLPHWLQAKIIKAKELIDSAKHYLEFELKEPQIDANLGLTERIMQRIKEKLK